MNIGLILIAAGQSRRLGRPKQLLPFKGSSLINHALQIALAAPTNSTSLVLGANAARIQQQLPDGDYKVVRNENWQMGMGKSIAVGVEAANTVNWDGLIICLADQPYLTVNILEKLCAMAKQHPDDIIMSTYTTGKGPPSYFPKRYFVQLAQLDDDRGAKPVVKAAGGTPFFIDFPKGHLDVDTESDLIHLI